MLKKGSTVLSIWSGINFFLAALILTTLVVFNANSPLLVMVFDKPEIAELDAKVIVSLNALTILYNSCSVMVSVLVWTVIRKCLLPSQNAVGWTNVLCFAAGLLATILGIMGAPWAHFVSSVLFFGSAYTFRQSLLVIPPFFFEKFIACWTSQNVMARILASGMLHMRLSARDRSMS